MWECLDEASLPETGWASKQSLNWSFHCTTILTPERKLQLLAMAQQIICLLKDILLLGLQSWKRTHAELQ